MSESTPMTVAAPAPRGTPDEAVPDHADRTRLICFRIVVAMVLIGCLFRVAQYAARISYWHDEAALVMNIMDDTPRQLMGRLDWGQASPPLFLWAEKGLYEAFGPSEYVLRLVPLTASLIALVLFAILAWRVLPPIGAATAVALFAMADKLIWHASEVKQYSGDAFAAVLLIFLAIGARRPASLAARFFVISLVAAILAWFSHPAAIVLGAISLALLPSIVRSGPKAIAAWVIGNLLVVISFASLYQLSIRQHDPGLDFYWQDHFVDFAHPAKIPLWFARETYRIADHPYASLGAFMLILAICGAIGLSLRKQKTLLAITLIPFALTLLAAAAHKFPYTGDRITLYLMPGLILLSAAGFDWLLAISKRNWRLATALLVAPMLIMGISEGGYRLFVPRARSNIRPAVDYVRAHRAAGETLYVFAEGPDANHPDTYDGLGLELFCYWHHPDPPVYRTVSSVDALQGRRFWIVFAFLPRHRLKFMQSLLDDVSRVADEKQRFIDPYGGAAFLYERKNAPATQ